MLIKTRFIRSNTVLRDIPTGVCFQLTAQHGDPHTIYVVAANGHVNGRCGVVDLNTGEWHTLKVSTPVQPVSIVSAVVQQYVYQD